jgi:hypothetical protein
VGDKGRNKKETRAIQRSGVIEHAAVAGKTAERKVLAGGLTPREYARDLFKRDPGQPPSCPWCIMTLTEGKQIGPEHAKKQRRLLDRFILKDPIADLPFRTIRRGRSWTSERG